MISWNVVDLFKSSSNLPRVSADLEFVWHAEPRFAGFSSPRLTSESWVNAIISDSWQDVVGTIFFAESIVDPCKLNRELVMGFKCSQWNAGDECWFATQRALDQHVRQKHNFRTEIRFFAGGDGLAEGFGGRRLPNGAHHFCLHSLPASPWRGNGPITNDK